MKQGWTIQGLRALAAGLRNASLCDITALAVLVLASFEVNPACAAGSAHDFQMCPGKYALCAASTCKPTSQDITVNVIGGGTAQFPQYDCTCPIFFDGAIADLNGGNMQGSCEPSPGQIWSLYHPQSHIPQAITDWRRGPASAAPPLICPAKLNLGDQLVNCFSFACDPAGEINGVPVATCHCPLGESLDGTFVPPDTAYVTQAGQGDHAICEQHPVSGPVPSLSGTLP